MKPISAERSIESPTLWAKNGAFAILDQGLFAGANFLANILLARWLPPEQYGAFAVAYSAFLLLGSFHTAVLTEPLLVFGAGKYANHIQKYLGLLLYAHVGLALVVSLFLAMAALIFWQLGSATLAQALSGLAFASPFVLLLWLVRRAFYVSLQPQWAATGGALYILLMLAGMYGLYQRHMLSSGSALVVMGLAGLVAGLWLTFRQRPQWRFSRENPTPRMVLADHWGYGRWAVATAALIWVPGNIYYALLPIWLGLEGTAALRAVMNLIMPILHANSALSLLLVPAFVKAFREMGRAGLRRRVRQGLILLGASSVLYLGFLILFRSKLMAWLYGGKYGGYGNLLLIVGLLPLSVGAVAALGGALRAMEQPNRVFWCYVVSTAVTLTVGLWLAATLGVSGAVIGLLVSSVATAASMIFFLRDVIL